MMESHLLNLVPRLIESLRDELQHYGEMLALLDLQKEHVATAAVDGMHSNAALLKEQMEIIHSARQERQRCQESIAEALDQVGETAFANLIPLLPEKFRGAVRALVRENNELLIRVQHRARQNHLLLSRSVDLMQQFLATLAANVPSPNFPEQGLLDDAAAESLR